MENLVNRLRYANGRRYRLLETLQAQQDKLDQFVNVGINPEAFVSTTPTRMVPLEGNLPDPRSFWQGLELPTEQEEAELQADVDAEAEAEAMLECHEMLPKNEEDPNGN